LMTASVAFRDTFWNVPVWAQVALYVGAIVAVTVFVYGLAQRVRLWLAGRPEPRLDRIPERVALVGKHALGQAKTLSQAYPGVMHAIMFWGFLALFMGTVLATIDYDITVPLLGYKLLKGSFYLVYETVLDLFGLFFVLGLGMALWRRFVLRPERIDPTARFAGALALLLVINVTGFVMEACRLAAVRPAWAAWSPVGWFLAQGMLAAGMSAGGHRALAQADHRQAQAPHARRAAGTDPRRADPPRGALGVHDVHGVRGGVPGLHRHRGHDHRSAPLPRALGGGAPVHRAAVAPEHPARGQPVGAPRGRAARVGPGARRPAHGARSRGRVPLLGRVLGVVRQAQPGDRPGGGEDPQGGARELRRHAGGAVPRRGRPAARG